jgi:hypothetical protein
MPPDPNIPVIIEGWPGIYPAWKPVQSVLTFQGRLNAVVQVLDDYMARATARGEYIEADPCSLNPDPCPTSAL